MKLLDIIPVLVTDDSGTHTCYFGKVAGAASSSLFHLMSKQNFYLGSLHRECGKWIFTSQTKIWEELADEFGQVIQEQLLNDHPEKADINFQISSTIKELDEWPVSQIVIK